MGPPWRVLEEWKAQSSLTVRRVLGGEARRQVGGAGAGRALEAVLRHLEDNEDLLDLHLKLIDFLFSWGMDCRRAGNKDLANCFILRTSQGWALRMRGGMRGRWIGRETGTGSTMCISTEIAISKSPGRR